jgi:hypothetical protein
MALAKLSFFMLPKGTANAMAWPPLAAKGQMPFMLTQRTTDA